MSGYMIVRINECNPDKDPSYKERQTLWVCHDAPPPIAEWCLTDDEEQGWVFETHPEALELLGTLADPYLVIVPIAPAHTSREMYD